MGLLNYTHKIMYQISSHKLIVTSVSPEYHSVQSNNLFQKALVKLRIMTHPAVNVENMTILSG